MADNRKYISIINKEGNDIYIKDVEARQSIANKADNTTFGGSGSGHSSGLVPDPGATQGNTKFLREDGTWQIPSGGIAYESKNAESGGVEVSLVTTGEKYIWNNKQDIISDLSTIRNGASAGATAYQKPSTGIPASDIKSGVIPTKASLGLDNVTNDAQVKRSEMGTASGVATLDSAGKVPSSQLPSYVDDVLEYDTKSDFPTTGETGKIYVDKSTNTTWRWSGSAYTQIKGDLAIGTTTGTAADGGVANTHYNNTSNPHSVTKEQVGLGSVVDTGDSATPVSGGTTKFTTGGAYTELNKKVDKVDGKGLSTNDYTTDEKNKLAGIAAGAEVNVQSDWNATSGDAVILNKPTIPAAAANGTYTVKTLVGSTTTDVSDFTADQSSADDVTFVQGSNITITPDATNRKITIAATDTTYSEATTSAAGLMSSSDKGKLNGIESGAQTHKAPTAAEVKSALGTGSGTSKYLREDGTWQTPEGGIDYTTIDSDIADINASVATNALLKTAQVLTASEKAQVKTNLSISDMELAGNATGPIIAQSNTSYTTAQVRNIVLSTSEPTSSDGNNGDIWIVYEA